MGLSLSDADKHHGFMEITSRDDESDTLFTMNGGVKEISDGIQILFEVMDKKGVANFTSSTDLVHIYLTDNDDEVMNVLLQVRDDGLKVEFSVSDPANGSPGDLFLIRLEEDWSWADDFFSGQSFLNIREFNITINNNEVLWLDYRLLLDVSTNESNHRFDIGIPDVFIDAEVNRLMLRLGGEEVLKVRESNPLQINIELPQYGYDIVEKFFERYLWRWFRYDPMLDFTGTDLNVIDSYSDFTNDTFVAWVHFQVTQETGGDLDYLYAALDVDIDIEDALNWEIDLNEAYVVLNEKNDTIILSNTRLLMEGSELFNLTFVMPTMNLSAFDLTVHGTAVAGITDENMNVDLSILNDKFIKEVARFGLNVDFDIEDELLWHINIKEVDFFLTGMQMVYFEFDTSVNGTAVNDMEWLVHHMTLTLLDVVLAEAYQMRAVIYVDEHLEIGFKWTENLDNVMDTGAIIFWETEGSDDNTVDDVLKLEFERLDAIFGNYDLVSGTMNVSVMAQNLFDLYAVVSDIQLTLFDQRISDEGHIDGHIHILTDKETMDVAFSVTEKESPKFFMGILAAWRAESVTDMSINIEKAVMIVGDDDYALADLAMNFTTTDADNGIQWEVSDMDLTLFNIKLATNGKGTCGYDTPNNEIDAWIIINDEYGSGNEELLFDLRFTASARFNRTHQFDNEHFFAHKLTHKYARRVSAAHIIAKKIGTPGHYILLNSPHTIKVDANFIFFIIPSSIIIRIDDWDLTLFDHQIGTDPAAYALMSLEDPEEMEAGFGISDGDSTVFDIGAVMSVTSDSNVDFRLDISKFGNVINDETWATFVGVIEVPVHIHHDLYIRGDVEAVRFPFDAYMYDDLTLHLALNVSDERLAMDVDMFDNKVSGMKHVLMLNVLTSMRLENIDNFTISFDQLAFQWRGKHDHDMDMSGSVLDFTEDL